MKKKKKRKLHIHKRVGRLFAVMVGIVTVILIADTGKRELFRESINNSNVSSEGCFISEENPSIPPKTTPLDSVKKPHNTGKKKASGFETRELTEEEITSGFLVLDNEEHSSFTGDIKKMVDISKTKNECYTVMGENVMLNEEAAEALNLLMADYCEETSLKDFVVYGTTDTYVGSDSYCPRYFPERATGNTIDLALIAYGSYITYDGLDEESWIIDNCAKYGFIVRYPNEKTDITGKVYCPWHLRYVGKLNAAIMKAKNMCLEEYVEFIKDYNADAPFTYRMNGSTYIVYSAKTTGKTTSVRVPVSGEYEISGDNFDTYIISYER